MRIMPALATSYPGMPPGVFRPCHLRIDDSQAPAAFLGEFIALGNRSPRGCADEHASTVRKPMRSVDAYPHWCAFIVSTAD